MKKLLASLVLAAAVLGVSAPAAAQTQDISPETAMAAVRWVSEYNSRAAWYFGVEAQRQIDAQAAARSRSPGSTSSSSCGSDFACFRECTFGNESGGNYAVTSPSGTYRGAWQFDQQTWDSNASASGRQDLVGQDPAAASPGDQDAVAHDTWQRRGNQPWGGRC